MMRIWILFSGAVNEPGWDFQDAYASSDEAMAHMQRLADGPARLDECSTELDKVYVYGSMEYRILETEVK